MNSDSLRAASLAPTFDHVRGSRPARWPAAAISLTGERLALAAVLAGSLILFAWNLAASGWANAYYSAAVLAGSRDWMAFLFGSFDAANSITVDKTPAALWIMELSARIFGFNAWSVLLPQAVEGTLAVWLLYLTVRRVAGAWAGLIAGAVLALTPVSEWVSQTFTPRTIGGLAVYNLIAR